MSYIDCTKSRLAKYRTSTENNLEQTCYYAQTKKDRLYNQFLARNLNENPYDLTLTIDRVTNTLEKARQNPNNISNDGRNNLLKKEKNGHEPDAGTTEQNDKGDDKGKAKRKKGPQFLLL